MQKMERKVGILKKKKEEAKLFQQPDGQMNLFSPGFLRDADCTKDSPVVFGRADSPVYEKGVRIRPRIPGRKDTKHMEAVFLPELLPLECYDLVVVLLSGGKDSIACFISFWSLGCQGRKSSAGTTI